jgi:hypothetical protein
LSDVLNSMQESEEEEDEDRKRLVAVASVAILLAGLESGLDSDIASIPFRQNVMVLGNITQDMLF